MGWLSGIFGVISAFATDFLGHIVAHDVCEMVPTFSARLVRAAAQSLPKHVRARYLNEWLADLGDQKGVFLKLKWAFGCFRCARRMSRAATMDLYARISIVAIFAQHAPIELNYPTFIVVGVAVKVFRRANFLPRKARGFVTAVIAAVAGARWLAAGKLDGAKAGRVLELSLENADGFGIELYFDGQLRSQSGRRR